MMDAPKRYVATDLDPPMREAPRGAWVHYNEHARLTAEKDARIAELSAALTKIANGSILTLGDPRVLRDFAGAVMVGRDAPALKGQTND